MENNAFTKFSKPTIWTSRYGILRSTGHLSSELFSTKMHNQSDHEKTTDKFKLGHILQNNSPILYKNCQG